MIKNHGLVIPKISTREEGAEHLLGGANDLGVVINPSGDWTLYLPDKEPQNVRGVETNACTIYATLNAIETLILFKTGIQVDYSNRYLANVAKKYGKLDPFKGADPHSIAELIRTIAGCLKEDRLPDWTDKIKTTDDYYALQELTDLMKEGVRWYDEWDLQHKWLWNTGDSVETKHKNLAEGLTKGTCCVSVVAWIEEFGIYVKQKGDKDGHWTMASKINSKNRPVIFDSYDGFIKELSENYDFNIGKVFYLQPASVKFSILQKILDIIGKILNITAIQIKNLEPVIPIDQTPPPPATADKKPIETIEQMCRRVCLEEGLTEEMTKQLLGTIKCESNFNPKAIHKNPNGTTDYGIIQANSYWYIGKNKPIPDIDTALNNPTFCVRVMARRFKAGGGRDWNCWKKLYGK